MFQHVVRDVPDVHREVYALLDRMTGPAADLWYLALVLFRGAAKSTIKTFKSAQDVCHASEPVLLFLSESEDQSIRDLISLQDEILCNDMLRTLYGELKGDSLWNRTECEFANGVYVAAKGWRSKVRGIKWKMQRPTWLWLDDFEGEGNSKTPEARAQVVQWINSQVMPAGDIDMKLAFLGTIVHPESYLASIKTLSMFNGGRGAYYERPIARTIDGEDPAWPSRYPAEWILAKRRYYDERNELSDFLQEYFNIPKQVSSPKFRMDMVQEVEGGSFCKYGPITYIDTATGKIPINVFIGVDPAGTVSNKSDRTVIFVLGVLPNKRKIILDIFADRIDVIGQINETMDLSLKYGAKQTVIETYGYQTSLYTLIRNRQHELNRYFVLREYKENRSKSSKWLEGLCPDINGGNVGYLSGCRNIELFMQEGKSYSGGDTDHDDTLDGYFLAQFDSFAPQNYNVDEAIARFKTNANKRSDERVQSWVTL